jgi:hypothetical protein
MYKLRNQQRRNASYRHLQAVMKLSKALLA